MPRSKPRTGRVRTGKPATKTGQLLQDWHQNYSEMGIDFNALADGGDLIRVVIDNSALFSNSILKWSKLTIRWAFEPTDTTAFDHRQLAVMLVKIDEDDAGSALAIDSEEVVRELRRDGKIVRGPWIMSTMAVIGTDAVWFPSMSINFKPIVLKNFVMDREEDLAVLFTNLSAAFSATSQIVNFYTQGFVRVLK